RARRTVPHELRRRRQARESARRRRARRAAQGRPEADLHVASGTAGGGGTLAAAMGKVLERAPRPPRSADRKRQEGEEEWLKLQRQFARLSNGRRLTRSASNACSTRRWRRCGAISPKPSFARDGSWAAPTRRRTASLSCWSITTNCRATRSRTRKAMPPSKARSGRR